MRAVPQNNLHIVLLVIIQMVITNFIYLGPYITISILPFTILMMPLGWRTWQILLGAAAVSVPVDLLAEGVLGMNMAALLPTVFVRQWMIFLYTPANQRDREGLISSEWLGNIRLILMIALMLATFLFIYTILECAGTRPMSFVCFKFIISLVINTLLYYPMALVILKLPKK